MFGNDLCLLVSDDNQIPIVVVRLINEIENKGKRDFLTVFVLALIHYIVDIFLLFALPTTFHLLRFISRRYLSEVSQCCES